MPKQPEKRHRHQAKLILFIVVFNFFGLAAAVFVTIFETNIVVAQQPVSVDDFSLLNHQLKMIERNTIIPDVRIPPIENGLVPIVTHLDTSQPVVFLTIDDGQTKLPQIPSLFKKHRLKASLFLTHDYVKNDTNFFNELINRGSLVENHTIVHPWLSRLNYDGQRAEICQAADAFGVSYGRRPVFFRPPYGAYNTDTRQAAADCGMLALIHWRVVVENGAVYYQDVNNLRPGDIVLMHFKPEFETDIEALVAALKAANLKVDLLENWL